MNEGGQALNWLLMVSCAIIWGFSYYFIKHALLAFTPMEVACVRIVAAGVVLLPFLLLSLRVIPSARYPMVLLCAVVGNGLPAFIYPLAQTHISSSVTGIVNSLTPLCTYLVAVIFFGMPGTRLKSWGVALGLAGAVGLVLLRSPSSASNDVRYLLIALCAPLMYGLNGNLLKRYLSDLPPVALTALMYGMLLAAALPVFLSVGLPARVMENPPAQTALLHAGLLGVLGTALAMTLFNILVRRADIMFAASITYLMPVVAVTIGIADGEDPGVPEAIALLMILGGVLMINTRFGRRDKTAS